MKGREGEGRTKVGRKFESIALLSCRGYCCLWTQEGVLTSEPLRKPGSLATEKNTEQELSETQTKGFSSAPAWGRTCSCT